jgi:hypothetical protein
LLHTKQERRNEKRLEREYIYRYHYRYSVRQYFIGNHSRLTHTHRKKEKERVYRISEKQQKTLRMVNKRSGTTSSTSPRRLRL